MNPPAAGRGPIAVLVVDDQSSFRAVAAEIIDAADGFTLFGTAVDSASAAAAVSGAGDPPDLVLMDVRLGTESGIETMALLHGLVPDLPIVLISTMREDELPLDVASSQAIAFLPKMALTPQALRQLWDDHRPTVSP